MSIGLLVVPPSPGTSIGLGPPRDRLEARVLAHTGSWPRERRTWEKSTGYSKQWRRRGEPPSTVRASATNASASCGTSRCAIRASRTSSPSSARPALWPGRRSQPSGAGSTSSTTGPTGTATRTRRRRWSTSGSPRSARSRSRAFGRSIRRRGPASEARKGTRPVWFGRAGGFVATPGLRPEPPRADHRFEGPAIVEEMDSTTLVLPGYAVTVDRFANLLVTRVRHLLDTS